MKDLFISDLTVKYKSKIILNELNLNGIKKGSVTVLLGRNGAGKSTLLKSISGLIEYKGNIIISNKNIKKMSFKHLSNVISYMPQDINKNIHLRVIDSLITTKMISGECSLDECKSLSFKILKQIGISDLTFNYIDELSGGQRQLVSLAQSLIKNPKVLLLDEPVSALDLKYQLIVLKFILEETKKRGIITIIILHDINLALKYSKYSILLNDGKIKAFGFTKEVITTNNIKLIYDVEGDIYSISNKLTFFNPLT